LAIPHSLHPVEHLNVHHPRESLGEKGEKETMNKKRQVRLLSSLSAALIAALAITGLAAASASASSWYINGSPYAGEKTFVAVPTSGHAGSVHMDAINANLHYVLDCRSEGSGKIYGGTKMQGELLISNCVPVGYESQCIQSNTMKYAFEGTGDAMAFPTPSNKIEWVKGKGCTIANPIEMVMPSLPLTYSPELCPGGSWDLVQFGSGVGKLGKLTNTITTKFEWWNPEGSPKFGWC
jgi:hypothetical protein